MFLGLTNFYWPFIQGFSKIAAPVTLILKIATFSPTNVEKILKAPNNSNFLTSKAKLPF